MADFSQFTDLNFVIYALVALGVFLLFTGVTQLLSRSENRLEAKNRRLRMIGKGRSTEEVLAILKPDTGGGILTRLPFIGNLPQLLSQAGLTLRPGAFVLLMIFATAFAFLLGLIYLSLPKAILFALALGVGVPVSVVRSKRKKRMDQLVGQLPDALDLLARGLRVGHPLNTSIGAVAEEMADPIGTEFGIIYDQVSYGEDLTDAFQQFADRVDLEDVHYLSASIGIQHGTGGDLARIVNVLSRVVRDRIMMRRKIHAISSEGRMTMYILSAIPVVIYTYTSIMTPSYYGGVADDPLYVPMAMAVVVLSVLNFLTLRKLVNFHI
ncbi:MULTISPECIES: type II secretion system F family protein [Halocynthiibacter]|uniref:Type II secretion system F family protein n=1 Tax=Halocynthiibacter halioticoli TaxID=2986804 RepID=A0AAE3J0F7_9RHOB|nr:MULTISPECIES: type II secretion system F family protein [Halocynthiibacter]MCV6824435.1 type II secretion system F family protein [Halocynthiibacter halioticoli]MCW4057436.1 type II secretion system F family protein [Halocynthiibacter sp. SDUM655004]